MNLREVVVEGAIVLDLKSRDKHGAIRELVDELRASEFLAEKDVEDVLSALYEREKLGSTGIGRGVAVPHAKHVAAEKVIGAIGLSSEGIDFRALDGQLVYVVFLFLSNPDAKGEHVLLLERVSGLLTREADLCRFIRRAKTQEEVLALLEEADERLGGR